MPLNESPSKLLNGHSTKKQVVDMGTQTEILSMNYIPPKVLSAFALESDTYSGFVFKPHMLTLLSILCLVMGYSVYQYSVSPGEGSFTKNSQLGLVAAFGMIIYYGALYFPSSLMQRPHYSFWRIILAIAICYCAMIIFILFQNTEDTQWFFRKFLDSKLGEPLPEKDYGSTCGFTWPHVKDSLDIFIVAHFFGWYFKMLVVRDWKFCTFLSCFFEFLELTFKHWLPNFSECWWDSLILDIIICNGLGIYVGHLHIKYFQMKTFKWTKNKQVNKRSIFGNFSHFVSDTPMLSRDWHIFSSSKRLLSVIWFIILMNAVDLSNFFNKFVLWIPASHYTLTIRIFLWGFLSIACTREYFEYIENSMFFRLGPFLFIGHLILFVEYSILLKFSWGQGYFTAPFPTWIKVVWTVIFSSLAIILLVLFYRETRRKIRQWTRKEAVKQE